MRPIHSCILISLSAMALVITESRGLAGGGGNDPGAMSLITPSVISDIALSSSQSVFRTEFPNGRGPASLMAEHQITIAKVDTQINRQTIASIDWTTDQKERGGDAEVAVTFVGQVEGSDARAKGLNIVRVYTNPSGGTQAHVLYFVGRFQTKFDHVLMNKGDFIAHLYGQVILDGAGAQFLKAEGNKAKFTAMFGHAQMELGIKMEYKDYTAYLFGQIDETLPQSQWQHSIQLAVSKDLGGNRGSFGIAAGVVDQAQPGNPHESERVLYFSGGYSNSGILFGESRLPGGNSTPAILDSTYAPGPK